MSGNGKRILVVDDELGFHDLFRYVLEPAGFTVRTAVDGEEALKEAREHAYDIIFSDVHMPRLSGPEFLQEMKKITGMGVVVNTSFNRNREPMVCSPLDAISCFYGSGIDCLVMGNYVLEKK